MNKPRPPEDLLDRIVGKITLGALGVLLLFTPLAFGSVYPWAYSIAEVLIFGLAILCSSRMLRLCVYFGHHRYHLSEFGRTQIPLALLVGFVFFQLTPLPASLLRTISPQTFETYRISLPGWPQKAPYSGADFTGGDRTPGELSRSPSPASATLSGAMSAPRALWRPLSLAPSLTRRALLGLIACAVLLEIVASLVAFSDDHWVLQWLVIAALFAGLSVGAIGLLQRATWNGKILWVFVPLSWGRPMLDELRARGPFVNPDNFAAYLSMILPLALACALFPMPFTGKRWSGTFRIFSAITALTALCGILLSMSRNGWIAVPISIVVLYLLASSRWRTANPKVLPSFLVNRLSFVACAMGLVILAFVLVGQQGREAIDIRLGTSGAGLQSMDRFTIWKAGALMVKDFPLLGIGLGNWPVLFTKYQAPPNWGLFFDYAHNDYLQLIAETGIFGCVLFVGCVWSLAALIRRHIVRIDVKLVPLAAGLISAIAVALFMEIFDCGLQITANAILFATLLGTLIGIAQLPHLVTSTKSWLARRWADSAVAAIPLILLISASVSQGMTPYPYDVKVPTTLAQAHTMLLTYPTNSYAHTMLASLWPPCSEQDLQEEQIAVWLDPTNPALHDRYANNLFCAGKREAALHQIQLSVAFAPNPEAHPYLAHDQVEASSSDMRAAVENGFKLALAHEYRGAAEGLAGYYDQLRRFHDEGVVFSTSAANVSDGERARGELIAAGEAFAKANQSEEARIAFEKAIRMMNTDPRPYVALVTLVYGPSKDFKGAQSVIERGITNGVDVIVLYSALADAAQVANRPEVASAAWTKIVDYAPTFQNNERLADFYLASGKADRAVDTMRKATMIAPDSAEAYVRLAAAEEAAYLYADADRDYSHALSLEPDNSEAKSRYAEFQKRTAAKGASAMGDPVN